MANTKILSEQIADDVALAGSPTTTTQSASDNSTKVATTAYVTSRDDYQTRTERDAVENN